MRIQYHFRPSGRGLLAWNVHRLVDLTSGFERIRVPLNDIRELDETFWYGREQDAPTCRSVALHARLINETDLRHPIILSADGGVMDGMHRVCKALIEGRREIEAVQFSTDPEPDYIGKEPDELPY